VKGTFAPVLSIRSEEHM